MTRSSSIRSRNDGFGAVLEALGDRRFDVWTLSDSTWSQMSPRQRAWLIEHANREVQSDNPLGQGDSASDNLARAVESAHALYAGLAPPRRGVLHPRHLDEWLAERSVVIIVEPDLGKGSMKHLLPDSYKIPDEGPQPERQPPVYLTLDVRLDASVERIQKALDDLLKALHPPATRRPKKPGRVRPERDRLDDDRLAQMIDWYYRRATGVALNALARELAESSRLDPDSCRTTIRRSLKDFNAEIGIT